MSREKRTPGDELSGLRAHDPARRRAGASAGARERLGIERDRTGVALRYAIAGLAGVVTLIVHRRQIFVRRKAA